MKKRILSILLSIIMLLGMLPVTVLPAFAESESSIVYLNEKGEVEATIGVAPITQYTTELTGGTYIVNSDITVNSRMYASGDVLLILADGHSLTVNGGIGLSGDNTVHHTLTITSQSFGGNMGRLNAYVGDSDSTSSAIGADKNSDYQNFDIVINGGNITATGGYYSAGIGSGWGNDAVSSSDSQSICGNITINGGNITATGGTGGAGIGAGNRSYNGKSACGNITVNGGNITATGGLEAAGIGSGESAFCGNITINGGNVTATGGSRGAGIGSGYEYRYCSCGDINVNGGYIKATGNDGGNNIGSGLDAHCGTVTYADGVIRKTEYGSEWVNITYIPGISATCVTSGYRDAYINLNDNQYYSAFPFPKTALGGESDYQNWIKPENDGYILPLGHEWVSLEYYNEGHKCIHDGCDLGGVHEDTDMDGKCDVCGCAICSHNNTVVVYEWDEYYNQCLAKIKCNDCEAYVDYEISKRVELIEDTPGANCKTKGKGHYEATFATLGTAETASEFDTTYGDHHYVDYVCEYCGDERLGDAQKDAIKAIDYTADHSDDEAIKLLAETAEEAIDDSRSVAEILKIKNLTIGQIDAIKCINKEACEKPSKTVKWIVDGAKADISSAESIEDVANIRDECLAAIEKLTGTTHVHTYGEATYIWNEDLTKCTAIKTCGCGLSVVETVDTVKNGNTVTATFTNDGFTEQEKIVEEVEDEAEKALKEAKTAAKAAIDNTVKNEDNDIKNYGEAAKGDIDELTTITAVTEKLTAALAEINAMKTQKAKAAALKELDNAAKNAVATKSKAIAQAAKQLIENAKSTDEANAILAEALTKIAGEEKTLANAKTAAKAAVDSAAGSKQSTEMKKIVSEVKADIDGAKSLEEVENAKKIGLERIEAQKQAEKPTEPDEPTKPSDKCPKCGGTHADNFWGQIVCFFNRVINWFKNLF